MAFTDPYVDPATGILRNKINAQTQVALDVAEGDLVYARMIQLLQAPPRPSGDLDELSAVHSHLFQDLYDWAGQVRTVDIRKQGENAVPFMPVSVVHRGIQNAGEQLHADNDLKGLSRDRFVSRLAHHYDQFNYAHPFREGNGRTQRFMFSRIARDAGWELDWQQVTGEINNTASRIAGDTGEIGPLHQMFGHIVTEATPQADRGDTWSRLEAIRLGAPLRHVQLPESLQELTDNIRGIASQIGNKVLEERGGEAHYWEGSGRDPGPTGPETTL